MDDAALEKLPRFSWAEIKKHLAEKKPFEAITPLGTALVRVRAYEPLFALAVHAGHRVREEFLSKMAIDDEARRYEEDSFVEEFVADFPVQMIGLDSRYEYDLNRARDKSVYLKPFESWGKKVWQNPPSKEELEISYQKYDEFHDIADFLVEQFEAMFDNVLLFDVHSYNGKRPNYGARTAPLPIFNFATSAEDRKAHGPLLDRIVQGFRKADLGGAEPTVAENDVFKKDGAVASTLSQNHPKSLFLPIEVKKIYMDEVTGKKDPKMPGRIAAVFSSIGRDALSRFAR